MVVAWGASSEAAPSEAPEAAAGAPPARTRTVTTTNTDSIFPRVSEEITGGAGRNNVGQEKSSVLSFFALDAHKNGTTNFSLAVLLTQGSQPCMHETLRQTYKKFYAPEQMG